MKVKVRLLHFTLSLYQTSGTSDSALLARALFWDVHVTLDLPWRKSFREVMKLFMKFHDIFHGKNIPSNVHEISWHFSWNFIMNEISSTWVSWNFTKSCNFMKFGFDRVGLKTITTGRSLYKCHQLSFQAKFCRHKTIHFHC
jgi:hypothetical protein